MGRSPQVSPPARGGGSPPRVGSNALNALQGKAFSERSEDFSAAWRRESNGIFAGCRKSPWTFSTACGEKPAGFSPEKKSRQTGETSEPSVWNLSCLQMLTDCWTPARRRGPAPEKSEWTAGRSAQRAGRRPAGSDRGAGVQRALHSPPAPEGRHSWPRPARRR